MDKALLTRNISVLIPTHGRPTLLGRTLESLSKCDIPKGYAETVVIENGPKSGAEAVVGDAAVDYPHLNLRYMHVERANKSHALNEALKTIADGLVVFFDDDVRLEPGVLEAYAEAAEAHPEPAFFGGSLGVDYEKRPAEWLIPYLPASARGVEFGDGDEPRWFLGANWAAQVENIVSLGGFSVDHGPGSSSGSTGQETHMQRTLRASGLRRVVVPNALVWHYVPQHACTIPWMLRRRFRGGVEAGQRARQEARRGLLLPHLFRLCRGGAAVAKQTLLRREEGRVIALCGVYESAGIIKGYYSA